LSSGGQNQKLESGMAKPLKDQAFATPDKVVELVQKVGRYIIYIIYSLNYRTVFCEDSLRGTPRIGR